MRLTIETSADGPAAWEALRQAAADVAARLRYHHERVTMHTCACRRGVVAEAGAAAFPFWTSRTTIDHPAPLPPVLDML